MEGAKRAVEDRGEGVVAFWMTISAAAVADAVGEEGGGSTRLATPSAGNAVSYCTVQKV